MPRIPLLIGASLLLSACQHHNPYHAQSAEFPDAPAAAENHFDASAYPIKSADLSSYRNWQWADVPVLSNNADISFADVQNLTGAELDQRGLRPSQQEQAQLSVQVSLHTSKRTEYRDYYPDAYYDAGRYSRHGRHGYSGYGASIPLTTSSYTERYVVAKISFQDNATGQVVWQGQGEAVMQSDLQKAVSSALKQALKQF